MINIIRGNIFNTNCECIVNTINCVGFMGKGIALEMSIRYPEMEQVYKQMCSEGEIQVGKLWLFRPATEKKKVLNFPTKYDYKMPSKIEYIESGLQYFVDNYKHYGIKSIAFSLLGATNGKLKPEQSLAIMKKYLSGIPDLHIEIYIFDKNQYIIDQQFLDFIKYLKAHPTPKNNRIYKIINDNKNLLNFADVVETKVPEEHPDGTYKRLSIATKKYLQSIVAYLDSEEALSHSGMLF